jgi:hypothetical protein
MYVMFEQKENIFSNKNYAMFDQKTMQLYLILINYQFLFGK